MATIRLTIKSNDSDKNTHVILSSIYMPSVVKNNRGSNEIVNEPVNQNIEDLVEYCRNNNTELIICCDSNAHHQAWGNKDNNIRGINLKEFIDREELYVINKGATPTYVQGNKKSIIDLTITTRGAIELIDKWTVLDEMNQSDHNSIEFELADLHTIEESSRNKRRTDWVRMEKLMRKECKQLDKNDPGNTTTLDTMAEAFNCALMNCFENSCRIKAVKRRNEAEWFTEKLRKERADLRKLFDKSRAKNLSKERKSALAEEFISKRNEYEKSCKRAKRTAWAKFTGKLEQTKDIARMQKLMENNRQPNIRILKTKQGKMTDNNNEVVEELMNTHFPDCTIIADRVETIDTDQMNLSAEELSDIDKLTSTEKIKWAVGSLGPYKTAGQDGIFPALLQKTLDSTITHIQRLFRGSLKLGHIPKIWRGITVTFIPKPGKDTYESASSYRPISLMSFMLKTLEKLIDRKLRDEELLANPLHKNQHAYQKGKGTESALHQLTHTIEVTGEGRVLVAFVDIAGAFDNTSFNTIMEALERIGSKRWINKWITEMLETRKVKANIGNCHQEYSPTKGCPQGGCLSPLLWSIVIDPLLVKLDEEKLGTSGYADDLAISTMGNKRFINSLADNLNKGLKTVETWCNTTGLKVNPSKTYFMKFSKGTKDETLKHIKIYGAEVQRVKEFKYLGVTFDEKLNWGKHIEYIKGKGLRTLAASKKMVTSRWGLTPKAMLWTYKQIVLPRVSYGSIVWWHVMNKDKHKNTLGKIQRMALMMTTGAVRSTPTKALEALLDVLPIDIHIEMTAAKGCGRLMKAGTWIDLNKGGEQGKHRRLETAINNLRGTETTDELEPEWEEIRNYEIMINGRNDWSKGTEINNMDCWYTDGSVRGDRVALGIYNAKRRIKISYRLSDHGTIMQAETMGAKECARLCNNNWLKGKKITICTDSQATLKALDNPLTKTKTVKACKEELSKLGKRNKVTLIWVPGHQAIEGNEEADKLAVMGTTKPDVDIELPIPRSELEDRVESLARATALERWEQSEGMRHAKKYIRGFESHKANFLIGQGRKEIRMLVGLLTGHGLTYDYLAKCKKMEEKDCRLCNEEKETIAHWMEECVALTSRERILRGRMATENKDLHYKNIGNFARYYRQIYESFLMEPAR